MDKRVSVIIPVYNVGNYLDRCMKSIVNQTYKNLEIILVDDGSTDQSAELCDRWAEKDERISVVHQNNGGPSNARNTGLDRARGDYLMFVDSDDVISFNIVEYLVGLLERERADISICDVLHIFNEGKAAFQSGAAEIRSYNRIEAIQELWYQKSFLPSACAKVYRKEIFGSLRFAEGKIFEDIDLLHELFWQCRRIVYSNAQLYGYVHRKNSITTRKFSQSDCVILKIAEKMQRFAEANERALLPAAKAYAVTAAFRVLLNAPRDNNKYNEAISQAETILMNMGKDVLKDKEVRKKTKAALLLYYCCRPLLFFVYKRKNRWK